LYKKVRKNREVSFNNSCFFDALSHLIPKEDLPWNSDLVFKKEFGLLEHNEVYIDLIPKIQEKVPKYKLLVTRDHIYISSIISHQKVKL
jgi:hypothetical protein